MGLSKLKNLFRLFYIKKTPTKSQEQGVKKEDFFCNFLWGSAVSEFQVSGAENCPHSQWSDWESRGVPYIKNGDRSEKSVDHWNLYREDIQEMKKLGLNSFRFSIEWSSIEPKEGCFDETAIDHYKDVFDALDEFEMTPMVTLYHFTHPKWFEDLGAFEKKENIEYFIRFSKFVFERFGNRAPLWCTINEPSSIVLMGYIRGEFPPGKKKLALAGEVYKHLLEGHCRLYAALKELPFGKEAKIGLVHGYLKLEPYHSWNPIESIPCYYMTRNLHGTMMEFLRNGVFNYYFPFKANVFARFIGAKDMYDFVGLNYYTRAVISMQWSLSEPLIGTCFKNEVMTDMPYGIYPKGLYDALLDCNTLGKPIYITENGIADAADDRRDRFIIEHISAMNQAMLDGCDVRGYFYWSFIDSFEWNNGKEMKFGLYEFDPTTKERRLKKGAKIYQNIIEETKQY